MVHGQAHNFLDLAFLHQPGSADIQEKMAETQEEHSILEVQEGETLLKQKACAAEAEEKPEKTVFDPQKVEMLVVP